MWKRKDQTVYHLLQIWKERAHVQILPNYLTKSHSTEDTLRTTVSNQRHSERRGCSFHNSSSHTDETDRRRKYKDKIKQSSGQIIKPTSEKENHPFTFKPFNSDDAEQEKRQVPYY